MTYTRKELAEVKALAEVATEGPWEEAAEFEGEIWCPSKTVSIADVRHRRDVLFIAASREAVPRLIAQVERLETLLRAVRDDEENNLLRTMLDDIDAYLGLNSRETP